MNMINDYLMSKDRELVELGIIMLLNSDKEVYDNFTEMTHKLEAQYQYPTAEIYKKESRIINLGFTYISKVSESLLEFYTEYISFKPSVELGTVIIHCYD